MADEKMQTKRKPMSKKQRFEVFKRDKFTCQYCGRQSPDVILEVDHIEPLCEGGEDDIMNYITSCRDCNRGKGKTKLTDDIVIKKQQEQLNELAEKREQLEMMLEWRKELIEFINKQVDMIDELCLSLTAENFSLSDIGKAKVRVLINRFGFNLVYEATEIALLQYYRQNDSEYAQERSFTNAIDKIGGICYNKKYLHMGCEE